eukprot:5235379-Amphidinium_carterae.1
MARDRRGTSLPVIGPASSLKGRSWTSGWLEIRKRLGIEASISAIKVEWVFRSLLSKKHQQQFTNKIILASPGAESYIVLRKLQKVIQKAAPIAQA